MSPRRLYRDLCYYLERTGWTREEHGSGWWMPPEEIRLLRGDTFDGPVDMFEGALRVQLERDGIDARDEP
jgi:hypothetical protein